MGWWGDNPPFHLHPRDPLELQGGTSFTFVSEGIGAAFELARDAANGSDVVVSGGGSIAKQYLAAGLIDELMIHLVPVLLSEGVRLLDEATVFEVNLEQLRAIEAPGVTHL